MTARDRAKALAAKAFLVGDRVGVHIQPAHYYSSVASRKELRANETSWRRTLSPMPFHWDLDEQADWLRSSTGYVHELPLSAVYAGAEQVGGFRYGPLEAQLLYSVIRSTHPSRIVEIGSGSSTWVMAQAATRNMSDDAPCTIVAIDPYTADRVAELDHVEAHRMSGADITRDLLDLKHGDILFIDSTHAVRTGSELGHIYLELVPQLPAGVVIHIHDIYLPYIFPPRIFESMFDWQETTLVAALLAGNASLEILAATSALHHGRPTVLHECFPEYRPALLRNGIFEREGHFPVSLWLRTR
jgi:predicted O-methyltransferase YrrM